MKKTCDNCRANNSGCDLGYKNKMHSINNIQYYYKPLENCQKPTTYKDYIFLMSIKLKELK